MPGLPLTVDLDIRREKTHCAALVSSFPDGYLFRNHPTPDFRAQTAVDVEDAESEEEKPAAWLGQRSPLIVPKKKSAVFCV